MPPRDVPLSDQAKWVAPNPTAAANHWQTRALRAEVALKQAAEAHGLLVDMLSYLLGVSADVGALREARAAMAEHFAAVASDETELRSNDG